LSESWNRLKSTRHTKYMCNYHFVWIPKHEDILDGKVIEYAKEVLEENSKRAWVRALHAELEHIHLSVSCPPRYAPSYLANYFKGKSARKILQRFPELKAGAERGKLWTRSYFVATAASVL